MAEDQAQGEDAQFTVNVDGQQIGGPQTITASQSAGQTQTFQFAGDWAPGQHNVTVTFVNNFIYPGLSGDRNAYVDGVAYDGNTISSGTTAIYQSPWFPPNSTDGNVYGNATFSVNDTTGLPSGASAPNSTPSAITVGSGSDTLVLNMAEDPYQGDAQFTVSVDGQQIGGVQTATAVVEGGQSQEFDVKGNFGGGTHTVTVDYLNDAVGGYYPAGTPGLPPTSGQWALDTEDRNLYVMGMSLDGGTPASGAPWELSSSGSESFSVTAGSNPSATASNSGLFASDGAAATGNNPAIPTGAPNTSSASTGSSSGMSFIASPTTTSTTASTTPAATTTATDPTGATTSTASSDPTTTDTTPSVAATVASTTPTVQDFTTPATASSSGTNPTSSTSGGNGNWWATHQAATGTGIYTHHHG